MLARLGSVPADPEEARALLRRRVSAVLGFAGALYGAVWIANAVVNAAFYPGFAPGRPTSLRSLVHGGCALLLAAGWGALRRWRGATVPALVAADAATCVVAGAALAGMVALGEAPRRPEMVAFLVLGQFLVLRAAIVPSTARRTMGLGVIASGVVLLGVATLHAQPGRPAELPSLTGVLVTAALWAAMSVATTGMVSFVIYGLHERVRAALRFGQYTLEEKLGEGGMGVVYRARHALLRRPTALKLLSTPFASEAAIARFQREVQLTASLSHPNIVSIYDFGRATDGRFYYAMEYLDGIDLDRLVAIDGPQPAGRVRQLLILAAEALAEAHAAGLVHRDIKPANMILCERRGGVDALKLLDFGLVRDTSPDAAASSDVFAIKGTPHYLSPEAITTPDAIDGRSDLYALGAVGYYLLTGTDVFGGASTMEVCAAHVYKAPEPPSRRSPRPIPASLEAVILRCLEKRREARPADAGELVRALEACDDAPAWSVDAARAWWGARAPALRRPERPSGAPTKDAVGLAIDPGGRG